MREIVVRDAFASVLGAGRGRAPASELSRADRDVIAAFIAGRVRDGDALYSRPGRVPGSGLLLCEGQTLAGFSQRTLLLAAEPLRGALARAASEELQGFARVLGVHTSALAPFAA